MARVLVIEDNRANLELMVYLLRAFGHEALSATCGLDGFEMARRERPDLIVCDLQMPDVDGYAVLAGIREEPSLRGTPVLAVTAFAMVGDRERVLSAGFDGYLAKPIEPQGFVASLERVMKGADSRRPAPRHPPPGRVGSILVVDDVDANALFVRSVLEPIGYRVVHCTGIAEALAEARASVPDVIISDLHLRKESGLDLLRALAADAALSRVPVVVLSSTVFPERDAAAALALGAARFVARTVEPGRLLAELEACLRERAG